MGFWNARQKMGAAAAILAGGILFSRLMGLVRDKVISYYFGATFESDVYFAAFVIPDFINYLLAGGYFSITLIPLLAERFERDEADGWRLFSAVFTWVVLAALAVTGAAMLAAPSLARLAGPGFPPEALARLTAFLRIILPAQVFFLAGSILTAILYLRRQFVIPALIPLVYNGAIILVGLLGIRRGMDGFCWGVLAGSLLGNFLLPLTAAMAGGGVRLAPRLTHPGLKVFWLLALPLMLGQSVVVLDEQFLRLFGSLAGEGAVSWLNYARRLLFVPVGVVAQAAGVASYPFLAGLAAAGEHERFDRTMKSTLTGMAVFMLPMAVWLILAAEPAVRLIFAQGRFGPADVAATALALRIMLLSAFFWGLQQVVGRSFYAVKDTLTPTIVGSLATLASLPLYWAGARSLGTAGVALASVASVTAYALAVSWLWRRRRGGGGFAGLGLEAGRALLVSGLAAMPAAAVQYGLGAVLPASLGGVLVLLLASGLTFAAVCLALAPRFAPELAARVRERLPGCLKRTKARSQA
jgi:putative peptidoglycan lipid II flippase